MVTISVHPAPLISSRLTYWVVFGIFGTLETFIHVIVYWIPFYFPLKVAFLLWCMHPAYSGASVIYNNLLKEFIQKHIHHVDKVIAEVDPSKIISSVTNVVTPNSTPTPTVQQVETTDTPTPAAPSS
jgi:hypothetical protein